MMSPALSGPSALIRTANPAAGGDLATTHSFISMQRDGHALQPPHSVAEYGDLVRYLNQLNAEWVRAAERLSPTVLIELLGYSGPAVADVIASVPPHAPALLGVAWAGEQQSEHWMDTGREYTERWHHQMQIRDAVRIPALPKRYLSRSG